MAANSAALPPGAPVTPKFDLFRLPAASAFMEAAWDALDKAEFLADMHRECGGFNVRAGRIILAEERWRRPHHCPARYTYVDGKTTTVMQLQLTQNELRLVFRTGLSVGKSRWGARPAGVVEPIRKVTDERRLILSLNALDNVPVRDCFSFLLGGMPREGWLRLCGGADVKGDRPVGKEESPTDSLTTSPAVAT